LLFETAVFAPSPTLVDFEVIQLWAGQSRSGTALVSLLSAHA
jgi:hypothetical protein